MFYTANVSCYVVCVILYLMSRIVSSLILVSSVFYTAVLTVRFSETTYSGTESSGVVPVTLMLEGGISPFVITVTVIPSDQSAEGKR